eukprot:12535534-Alexandrium_andersonii.AAC.1
MDLDARRRLRGRAMHEVLEHPHPHLAADAVAGGLLAVRKDARRLREDAAVLHHGRVQRRVECAREEEDLRAERALVA